MIKTCSFVAVLSLACLAQDPPAPPASPAPSASPAVEKKGDADLDKSAAQAADWSAYTFTASTKTTGMGKTDAASNAVVKVAKGTPWSIKSGETEGFRQGSALITKEADGSWKRFEPAPKEKGKKGKKGEVGGPGALLAIKAPHEFLKDFGTKLKDIKREDGEGGRTYTAELTSEAARDFATAGAAKGPGGKGPDLTYSGSAKVSVNVKTGEIVKIEITTEAKGTMKEREIDVKRTSTYEISDVGTTKVEVPDDAKKALSD